MLQKLEKFNKIFLPTAIVVILILVGFLVWVRWPKGISDTDKIELSDRAETFSAVTNRDYLVFKEISVDPFKVKEGETQKFILTIEDGLGIKSIEAGFQHDLGEDSKKMKLIEGDNKSGKWLVSWVTHDLSSKEYQTVFRAKNNEGKTEEVTFFWQYEPSENVNKLGWIGRLKYLVFSSLSEALAGECSFSAGTHNTMNSDCSISGISGVDGGNLTISSNRTLQLNEGSNLVFNPGNSIGVNGTIWVNQPDSEISKGYICVTDSDNDGCWVGTKTKSTSPTCPAGKRRLKDASYYPDCDDNNVSYCQTCCYPHDRRACYDDDVYWYDACNQREEKYSECGSDDWGSSYQCSGATRQRQWIDRGCSGTSCFANTSWRSYQDCGSDSWTNNYRCSGSDRQRQIRRQGCSGTSCYDYYEWVTVENCGSGYWTNNYQCSGSTLQRQWIDRGCSGTSCFANTSWRSYQDCGSDSWTNNYQCSGRDRQRQILRRGCSGSSCYSRYEWVTIETCSYCCSGSTCSGECSPGQTRGCSRSCSYKTCEGSSCVTKTNTASGTETCNSSCQWSGSCSASPSCPASTCSSDAQCVPTTCTDMTATANPFCESTVFRAVGTNIKKARADVYYPSLYGPIIWNSGWKNGTDVTWTGINKSGQKVGRPDVYLVLMYAQDASGNEIACNTVSWKSAFLWRDADGDGYTNKECMDLWPRNDCCDYDANAYPGQTSYFSTARNALCGGFDYNCDGTETKLWTVTNAYCACSGSNFTGKSGWKQSSIPNCGQKEKFIFSNPCHSILWWWDCDVNNNWAQKCK